MAGASGTSTTTTTMTTTSSSSNTSTACAACKYQRRKCSADCPLSPYFPPDQPKRFANVHKLFGVSNILRILKHVEPSKREDTVKSIAYEADTREKDPVHGCLGVITVLQNQVAKLKEELQQAREQLYLIEHQQALAAQQQAQQQLNPFQSHGGGPFDEDFDPKLSILPLDFDTNMLSNQVTTKADQAEQLRRAGSYFGNMDSSYDESPVSHHQMHTMAALDHDPSFHLRSYNYNDMKHQRGNNNNNNNNSFLLGHLSDHELRRAGVYLSLTNQH